MKPEGIMARLKFWALSAIILAFPAFAQTPAVSSGGVVNAASFAQGQAVVPGSLVSIFGTNLAAGLAQADSIPLSNSLNGASVGSARRNRHRRGDQ
jgi:hypothetical protein